MGEFLRKWVSWRLLVLNGGDIERVMAAMRRLGVRTPGGAEALAIFLLFDLWEEGGMTRPLARVKVDEKTCFGMLEWPAVRQASLQTLLPTHYPVACWKHAAASAVEQRGVDEMPKDRGAEQGDVDGPLECSLTLGGVTSGMRQEVHAVQRHGVIPWAAGDEAAVREATGDFDQRNARAIMWEATAPDLRRVADGSAAIVPDPRHEIQA